MSAISKAWDLAQLAFVWADYSALLKVGVDKRLMAHLCSQKYLGADFIKITDGRWHRQFRGDRAIVMPAFDDAGEEMVDLIAFRMDNPVSFWTLTGAAPLLGFECLEESQQREMPLFVHASPLEWLRAGCDGIVILDWKRYWPAYFEDIPALRTASVGFGRRLAKMLAHPLPIPEIQVAAP